MRPLHVDLDFACCACGRTVGVTVRCEGIGLASPNPVAAVKVPCPHCGGNNQVIFATDGTLHQVGRDRTSCRTPAPCMN